MDITANQELTQVFTRTLTATAACHRGIGAVGAGVGIGLIFNGVIDSVTRRPEMRDGITQIQWLNLVP